jgi:hypothetical protein
MSQNHIWRLKNIQAKVTHKSRPRYDGRAACRTPSVIGLAAQTNHLVTAMQIPVDPEFDNAK